MASLTVAENPLTEGGEATVCVTGATGPTTTVTVNNGGVPPVTQDITIDIDDNGEGCAKWPVPDWSVANFNWGECPVVTRQIVPS